MDPLLHKQWLLDKLRDNRVVEIKEKPVEYYRPTFAPIKLESITQLSDDNIARSYVLARKIPEQFWDHLYYAPEFKDFVDEIKPNHEKKLWADDPRLIIPFYDEHQTLLGFQGRSLGDSKIRYITIKLCSDDLKVFGLDRVNKNNKIYVLEGPFDSMFLPNAVASCDSNISTFAKYLPKEQLVLVYDNEYHNKDIKRNIDHAIKEGFNVVLFPKSIHQKDLNEMIIDGMTPDELQKLVDNNTFSGLRAQLEWSKLKG